MKLFPISNQYCKVGKSINQQWHDIGNSSLHQLENHFLASLHRFMSSQHNRTYIEAWLFDISTAPYNFDRVIPNDLENWTILELFLPFMWEDRHV